VTIKQPLGVTTEFEIRFPTGPNHSMRTHVAVFSFESIAQIEALAGRYYGRPTTIFQMNASPGFLNLAIILIEAINHDADTGWGGDTKKPDVKKMIRMLGHVAQGQAFLETWYAVVKGIEANLRPPEAEVPLAPPSRTKPETATTATAGEVAPAPAGSSERSAPPSSSASAPTSSGGSPPDT
jgi:hypothetical protein